MTYMTSQVDAKSYYGSNGYVIFPGLIPAAKIDAYMATYRDILAPSKDLFLRQTTTKWAPHVYTEFGYLKESVKDPHSYDHPDSRKYGAFSSAVRDILCAKPVTAALEEATGYPAHTLTNSMFFDFNTATQPHFDAMYLDSIPAGHLLGGWFALEDIAEDAGRFFVIPGSHREEFNLTDEEKLSHDLFARTMKAYAERNAARVHVPALKKGDALFWNSMLVHGATATRDPKLSRKSLTAHYLPSQMGFGTLFNQVPNHMNCAVHEGMKYQLLPLSSPPKPRQEAARQFAKAVRDKYPAVYQAGRQAYRAVKSIVQ